MKTVISMALAAALALSLSTAANAVPTLVGTTTDPTAIDGLMVDGTTYNVTFSTTTLNTFTESSPLSVDAASALTAALNTLSVTELASTPVSTEYALDVDNSSTSFDAAVCLVSGNSSAPCAVGAWGSGSVGSGAGLGLSGDNSLDFEAADFSTASTTTGVPEPLTFTLFGAGLAGIGAMRRKKKAA